MSEEEPKQRPQENPHAPDIELKKKVSLIRAHSRQGDEFFTEWFSKIYVVFRHGEIEYLFDKFSTTLTDAIQHELKIDFEQADELVSFFLEYLLAFFVRCADERWENLSKDDLERLENITQEISKHSRRSP